MKKVSRFSLGRLFHTQTFYNTNNVWLNSHCSVCIFQKNFYNSLTFTIFVIISTQKGNFADYNYNFYL